MESFKSQNTEPKKEGGSFTGREKSNLAKNAKNFLVATGVVLSALVPGKSEAQKVKENEPIVVHDKNDPRLKTYEDSLDLYNSSVNALNFYKNNVNYNLTKEINLSKDSLVHKKNDEARISFGKQIRDSDPAMGIKGNKIVQVSNLTDYYKKVDKNRYEQKERNNVTINLDAPYQLFDRRINPDKYFFFKGKKGTIAEGDFAGMYSYSETLAPKPVQPIIYKSEVKKVDEKDIFLSETEEVNEHKDSVEIFSNQKKYEEDFKKGYRRIRAYENDPEYLKTKEFQKQKEYFKKQGYSFHSGVMGNNNLPRWEWIKDPLGNINIQGKSVEYYSKEHKESILNNLKAHNIIATKVGDSENYTVSRFDEKTKGWDGNKLVKTIITKDTETKKDKVESVTIIDLDDYK